MVVSSELSGAVSKIKTPSSASWINTFKSHTCRRLSALSFNSQSLHGTIGTWLFPTAILSPILLNHSKWTCERLVAGGPGWPLWAYLGALAQEVTWRSPVPAKNLFRLRRPGRVPRRLNGASDTSSRTQPGQHAGILTNFRYFRWAGTCGLPGRMTTRRLPIIVSDKVGWAWMLSARSRATAAVSTARTSSAISSQRPGRRCRRQDAFGLGLQDHLGQALGAADRLSPSAGGPRELGHDHFAGRRLWPRLR